MRRSKTSRKWSKWQHFVWALTPSCYRVPLSSKFTDVAQLEIWWNDKSQASYFTGCTHAAKENKMIYWFKLPVIFACNLRFVMSWHCKNWKAWGKLGTADSRNLANWVNQLSSMIVALRGNIKQLCYCRVGIIHATLIRFSPVQLKYNLYLTVVTNYWYTAEQTGWLLLSSPQFAIRQNWINYRQLSGNKLLF